MRDEIRRLLEDRGMSRRQLAEASGINLRAVDRKLKGESPFDVADLEAIAAVFGVTAAEIVAWAESR